jgi:hypothetical protein
MTDGPVWIEADRIRFSMSPGGLLTAVWNAKQAQVAASRLFPMTHPDSFIVLRDQSGQEWGVLRSLDGLEAASREALEQESRFRPFLPRITRIRQIQRRFSVWQWDVQTDAGPVAFRTGPLYESTVMLQNGCRLVTDSLDQKYLLPGEAALDGGSRLALSKWL